MPVPGLPVSLVGEQRRLGLQLDGPTTAAAAMGSDSGIRYGHGGPGPHHGIAAPPTGSESESLESHLHPIIMMIPASTHRLSFAGKLTLRLAD